MALSGARSELTNWAGSYVYTARELMRPASERELRELIEQAGSLRVLASRHSFNAIADADVLVSLERMAGAHRVSIDAQAMTVTVGAAVTFAELARELNGAGLALANLASLPHITIAGAIATATHGSGDDRGNLATLVRGLELLSGTGERVSLDAQDPRLAGAAVHLGALGIVLSVTLAVMPSYAVSQHVYEGLEWAALDEHLDEIFAQGLSVSVFHRLGERTQAVWVKALAGAPVPARLFGAIGADGPRHPVHGVDPVHTTPQLGEPGPWSERLPHFRSGFMPSAGEEIQSELFVERARAQEAIAALREIGSTLVDDLLVGELRTVAADTLWLSPQYRRASLGLHFTWRREPEAVARHVGRIEEALAPFAPRAHWGKVSTLVPDLAAAGWDRAGDFAALRAQLDPRGVFTNPWMRRHLPGLL